MKLVYCIQTYEYVEVDLKDEEEIEIANAALANDEESIEILEHWGIDYITDPWEDELMSIGIYDEDKNIDHIITLG